MQHTLTKHQSDYILSRINLWLREADFHKLSRPLFRSLLEHVEPPTETMDAEALAGYYFNAYMKIIDDA